MTLSILHSWTSAHTGTFSAIFALWLIIGISVAFMIPAKIILPPAIGFATLMTALSWAVWFRSR